MRGSKMVLTGAVLAFGMWGAAIAAPAVVPAQPAVEDCQKMGGEVSALIDKQNTSPNLPAARSAFQVGIMECMDGDDAAANKHYQDAKKLLTEDQKVTPPPAPAQKKQAG
jgi:hypothetical protein